MRRRQFLVGATAGAVSALGVGRISRAQMGRQPDPAKLARIAIMTFNFNGILKLPTQPASPARTLEILDVPDMLADMYGVHNVEFQHTHILSTEMSYLRDLRARLDKAKSRMSNVNLEFGTSNISAPDPADRQKAIDMTKQWIDFAPVLGTPRVMINQGALSEESKVWAIPALKQMVDYGQSKGIKVSVETRLTGGGRGRATGPAAAAGTAPTAAAPAAPVPTAPAPTGAAPAGRGTLAPQAVPPTNPAAGNAPGTSAAATAAPATMTTPPTWVLLAELIKSAGAYSNVDIGNVNAQDQGELHAALRTLLPLTVGNMHTRISPAFDLPTALRFITANLGYQGLFSIEAPGGHDAVRYIYNVILDTDEKKGPMIDHTYGRVSSRLLPVTRRAALGSLLALLVAAPTASSARWAPPARGDVIINEYAADNNANDADFFELLVLGDEVDLRGLRITDNELVNGVLNNGESVFTLGEDAYLSKVPRGTLIAVWTASAGVTTDTQVNPATGDWKLVLAPGTGVTIGADGLGGTINPGLANGGDALYVYLSGPDRSSAGTDNVYLDFVAWEDGDGAAAPPGLANLVLPDPADNAYFTGNTAANDDVAAWVRYDSGPNAKPTPGEPNPTQNLAALRRR